MEVYTFKVHRQAPRRRVDWADCGLYKANFQSPSDFREYTLFCVYIETAWYRESLQHRKAFVKLLPVFAPTLLQFCLSLYSHPLILTFTTHNSRCGPWGYHVPLQSSGGCVGSPTSFFFFRCVSPFWGHPFPLPHTGNHLAERRCGRFGG